MSRFKKDATDFRVIFAMLPPDALVSRSELAELLCTSPGAISQMIFRKQLPKTAFPGNRRSRWFVQDIRIWLNEQRSPSPPKPNGISDSNHKRAGRPRLIAK